MGTWRTVNLAQEHLKNVDGVGLAAKQKMDVKAEDLSGMNYGEPLNNWGFYPQLYPHLKMIICKTKYLFEQIETHKDFLCNRTLDT